ncbi:ABC transporter permease [Alcanivorax xiamenensis]|uniref:Transport permease protein n=1 Tax=Alcanivorax xiamenensis TaxID=1177156 RepID=A0ABQ6Y4U8_9GAMM|nr:MULTISPECIES: ABC transporter permease [Alcanivorax]KAF0804252.1 ABC transporter permease [Alcanivorax xiamenensis]
MSKPQIAHSKRRSDQLQPLPAERALEWGWEAMHEGLWREAVQRWATLRLVYPDQGPVWIQAGVAHHQLDEYECAAGLLEQARLRFPDNPNGWIRGALVAADGGMTESAVMLMEQARYRFPNDIDVWLTSAEVLFRAGERARAEALNAEVCRRFPKQAAGGCQYAEFAMRDHRWQEALSRWTRVRAQFPEHRQAFLRAAEAAERLGCASEAKKLRMGASFGADWVKSLEQTDQRDTQIRPPVRRNLRAFADLVVTKARLNLKAEANQNHLRYLWWIIDPLLYMAVFYLVFGLLLQRGGDNYVIYLLTGLVPFQWFAKTVQHAAATIIQGRGLMNLVRVSPLFFPLVAVAQNTGKQIPVFIMLVVLLFACGFYPTVHWLALVPVVAIQLMLMAAIGCLTAMIIPFLRDLLNLVPTGLQFILFCSGVFYTVDTIPEQWHSYFFANPMANLLHQYRLILMEHQWPDWGMTCWLALACMAGLVLVALVYRRLESVFPRVVIE